MADRMIDLLLRLSPRERILLALMGAVLLPGALWLGVGEPLLARHAAAVEARHETQALGLWLVDRAAEQAQIAATTQGARAPGGADPANPIGISGLEQSLVAAGLRPQVSELSAQSGGAVRLRFDAVQFTRLANWLSASDPGWGYDIAALRIERTDAPGAVAADLTLDPQG